MPFSQRIGGNVRRLGNVNNNITRNVECLSPKQTKYIYKKVELGSLIKKEIIKEEIDSDVELNRIDNNSRDENPYKELIVNNAIEVENALSQMEQWLIISNIINYVQYSKNPKDFYTMTIRPINNGKCSLALKEKDTEDMSLRIDLVDTLKGWLSFKSKEEYLDRYEGVISKVLNTTRFDKSTDLYTAYLGRFRMTWGNDLKVEEMFLIIEQGYTVGKLLDGTECQILLDTGASKSFISKS